MTNYQLAVWFGFIALAFTLGYLIGKYDDKR